MREEDFFSNIAKRLGRSTPLTMPPKRDVVGAPDFWREFNMSEPEKIATFKTELAKLGGQAESYDTLEELHKGLSKLLQELSPSLIGTWGGDLLADLRLDEVLLPYQTRVWEANDVENSSSNVVRDEWITTFVKMDVGITGADFAIANTGTTVVCCDPVKGRSISLLPAVHIVIIRSSRIRTRMGEVLDEIALKKGDPNRMPSSINFISGPSRSADIENDLSIGVHGPAAFYALILRDHKPD